MYPLLPVRNAWYLLWSLYIGLVGPQCIDMVAWIVVFVFSQKSPNRCSQLTLAPSRNSSFLVGFHIFRMSGCSSHRLSLSHQLRQSTPCNIKTFFTAKSLTTSDFRFPVPDSRFQIWDFIFRTSDSKFSLPDTMFQVSDFTFQVSGISDFQIQISDFGFQVSNII